MLIKNKRYQNLINFSINECFLDELNNKRIILTGCTGLIGSYIVDMIYMYNKSGKGLIQLIGINHNIDNCKKRFSYIDDRNIIFETSGVENFENKFGKIDYIVHAASYADPINFARYPVETIQGNILGTTNLLKITKENNAKFLFISSREVYGYLDNFSNYNEEFFGLCNFNQLRASYPESKRVSELLCRAYKSEFNVKACIARLGYVYGPTQSKTDSRAIAQFINNAVNSEDIILKSSGLQRRSYTFVSDCVSAIFMILLRGCDDVYNVSDEKSEISICELADMIAKCAKTNIKKAEQSDEERKGSSDNHDALLDCSKLHRLGWKPKYGLNKGIPCTIKIIKELKV